MNRYFSWILGIIVLALMTSCKNTPDTKFKVYANGFDVYEGFTVAFYHCDRNEPLLTTTIKNGSFSLEGDASVLKRGELVINETEEIARYKRPIVIEPGVLELVPDARNRLRAKGDNLTTKAIDIWLYDEKALRMEDKLLDMQRNDPESNENHPGFKEWRENLWGKNRERGRYIVGIVEDLAFNSDDETVALIAALCNRYCLSTIQCNLVLDNTTPTKENAYLLNCLKSKIDMETRLDAKTGDQMIGQTIEDFSVNDIDGKQYSLLDVISKNKYTLVEFWASWCGPCRREIPHMKKVYAKYKSKGFEIFSYSLDDKEKSWIKASEEDGIDWINTSDLLAERSPIVELFAVYGVPRNYLVDSEGKILAIDLRQEKLEEKVKELL